MSWFATHYFELTVLPENEPLVASFALMYLMGFSLNNLTLVAIVIAVGFVVDDAIVVVENIHRHLEAGLDKREAAMDAGLIHSESLLQDVPRRYGDYRPGNFSQSPAGGCSTSVAS